MPVSQWGPQLQEIHDAGFTSVRREGLVVRRREESTGAGIHTYDWTELDQFVSALAQHDLRWYATISPGAGWAGSGRASPPDDQHIPDYAAFGAALAKRYGDGGSFSQAHPELPYEPVRDFEIWNEPDLARFWVDDPSTAPERYGRMVAAAIPAIHAVDPSARIDAGALAPRGAAAWLGEMVQSNPGLRGEISTVSFHPYGLTAQRSLDRIVTLRHAIDRWLGRDVGIVISEDGITMPPGSRFTTDDRADLWRRLALRLPRTDCKVEGFLPHSWTGQRQDPTQEDQWYGMADWNTGQLDPSGVAVKSAILRMEGRGSDPPPATRLHLCYG
jgi:hypothetical protein